MTSAGDAFGRTVGTEKIGIYNSDDIRGFNPIDAGNARMEGLYFDQQEKPTPRLINGSTVRVGITAQGYPFPAPTGIVDYRLRSIAKEPEVSVELEQSTNGGKALAADSTFPIFGDKLGGFAGGILRKTVTPQDTGADVRAFGLSLDWHPFAHAEVIAFASGIDNRNETAAPIMFPAGDVLPPQIERGLYNGQDWARRNAKSRNSGVIAKLPLGQFRLEAGLFHSVKSTDIQFSDQFRSTQANGTVGNHVIIADADNLDKSTSGEVRLSRSWGSRTVRQSSALSAWASRAPPGTPRR